MRPVKNEKHLYYQIGDESDRGRIHSFSLCGNRDTCKQKYKNYDVTCGGYRAELQEDSVPRCLFYITEFEGETYLSATTRGGE